MRSEKTDAVALVKKIWLIPYMLIRKATLDDIPQILELIASVIPAMHAVGNFQWDSSYPNEEVFEKDIVLNQLWIAEAESAIAGVAAITQIRIPNMRMWVGIFLKPLLLHTVWQLAYSIKDWE